MSFNSFSVASCAKTLSQSWCLNQQMKADPQSRPALLTPPLSGSFQWKWCVNKFNLTCIVHDSRGVKAEGCKSHGSIGFRCKRWCTSLLLVVIQVYLCLEWITVILRRQTDWLEPLGVNRPDHQDGGKIEVLILHLMTQRSEKWWYGTCNCWYACGPLKEPFTQVKIMTLASHPHVTQN